MFENQKINQLRQRAAQLEAEATARTAETNRLQSELQATEDKMITVGAARDKARRQLAEIEARREAVEADLAAANLKVATFDRDVEQAVQIKFSALGGGPLEVVAEAAPITATGLARATAAHQQESKK